MRRPEGVVETFKSLSSLVPAAAALLALPFALKGRSEEPNVRAMYLFHRSGDPIATMASDVIEPLPGSLLEPVLGAVREIVEAEGAASGRVLQKTTRFGDEAVVGVRGQYVSACVVFHGRGDGMIRRDLIRFIREFEERNEGRLGTWEDATSLAGEASLALTGLIDGPSPSAMGGFEYSPAAN